MTTESQSQPPGSGNQGPTAILRRWLTTATVAGVFSLVLGLAMLLSHVGTKAEDPLKSPELRQLKEKLRLNPVDEQLKKQIRELDLQLRQTYFQQISRMKSGVYILLGGIAVFVLAVTRTTQLQRRLPMPEPKKDGSGEQTRVAALARWAVAASGGAIAAFLFLLTLGASTGLPKREAEIDKLLGGGEAVIATAAPDVASPEELRQNWTRFLGSEGNGVSASTNAPSSWDTKTGAGIAWKTAVPAIGFNSPIVWGNRVFFSGGDAVKREVFCLGAKTGQLLWRQPITNVPGTPAKPPEVPDTTGYAASTMATDGRRVYVIFANGDVAALTLEGKVVWSKSFGPLKNPYGHATSLATWQDKLILQLDQGDSEEGKSKLCALDGRTGQTVWQRQRKVGASWASPVVFEAGGKAQIVVLSIPWAIAYAAADGTELWKVECLGGEVTPSPIFAGGLVFVPSPSEKLLAIRPDGQTDVTKTNVVWGNEDNVPDVTSPTSNGELVFTVTTSGMLTCIDAKTGKKLWEHDFEMECHASPVLAANKVYILGQKGIAVVAEAGRQYKELFRTEMADAFHATPAIVQDRMFLRGVTNVWCIGPTLEKAGK